MEESSEPTVVHFSNLRMGPHAFVVIQFNSMHGGYWFIRSTPASEKLVTSSSCWYAHENASMLHLDHRLP
jgi:hypothetical protein